MAVRPGAGKNNSLKQPKGEITLKYMHRPPLITPNYGTHKRSLLPKSKVSRVLLYDNATQDHMLDIKLAHINIEKERINRLINLHKRSFSLRMTKRKNLMQAHTAGSRPKHATEAGEIIREKSRPTSMLPLARSDLTQIQDGGRLNFGGITFPSIDSEDKRHLIFKVKGKSGKTEVFHTVDNKGYLSDLIPMYKNFTDDPRFKSLQNILIPAESVESLEFY